MKVRPSCLPFSSVDRLGLKNKWSNVTVFVSVADEGFRYNWLICISGQLVLILLSFNRNQWFRNSTCLKLYIYCKCHILRELLTGSCHLSSNFMLSGSEICLFAFSPCLSLCLCFTHKLTFKKQESSCRKSGVVNCCHFVNLVCHAKMRIVLRI